MASNVLTEKVREAYFASQKIVTRRMEIYENDAETLWLPLSLSNRLCEGSVTVSADNDERRSFDITVGNKDNKLVHDEKHLWYDKIIKLYRGIKYLDDVPVPARRNLMDNPSFSSNLNGWIPSGLTISQSNTWAISGNYSMKMVSTAGAASCVIYYINAADFSSFGLQIGGTYTYSVYLHLEAAMTGTLPTSAGAIQVLSVGDAGQASLKITPAITNIAGTTVRRSLTFTVPDDSTQIQLRIWNSSPTAGDAIYADAVLLEEGSTLQDFFTGAYSDKPNVIPEEVTRQNLMPSPYYTPNSAWGNYVVGSTETISGGSVVNGKTAIRCTVTSDLNTRIGGYCNIAPLTTGTYWVGADITFSAGMPSGNVTLLAANNGSGGQVTYDSGSPSPGFTAVASGQTIRFSVRMTLTATGIVNRIYFYTNPATVPAIGEYIEINRVLITQIKPGEVQVPTYFDGDGVAVPPYMTRWDGVVGNSVSEVYRPARDNPDSPLFHYEWLGVADNSQSQQYVYEKQLVDYENQIGEFLIDGIHSQRFPAQVQITGRDYTKKLLGDYFPELTSFPSGSSLDSVVQTIATNGGIKKFRLGAKGAKLGSVATFDASSDRWSAIKSMCESLNIEVFFSADGYLVTREFLDVETASVDLVLSEEQGEQNIIDFSLDTSDANVFNDVVVINTTDADTVLGYNYYARAQNNDPSSPTSIPRIGRRSAPRFEVSYLNSNAEALKLAKSKLAISALQDYNLSIDTVCVPWLDANNIFQFWDPNEEHIAPEGQSYYSGLGPGTVTRKNLAPSPHLDDVANYLVQGAGGTMAVSNAWSMFSTTSLKLTSGTAASYIWVVNGNGTLSPVAWKPNTTYTASVYAYLPAAITATIPARIYVSAYYTDGTAANGSYAVSNISAKTAGSVTRLSVTFTTPANMAHMRIRFYTNSVTGTDVVYYDGLLIEEGVSAAGSFFAGDTVQDALYAYRWDGTPGHSTSIQYVPVGPSLDELPKQKIPVRYLLTDFEIPLALGPMSISGKRLMIIGDTDDIITPTFLSSDVADSVA